MKYYSEQAQNYFETTKNLDLSDLYNPFLKEVSPKGLILDAGCGFGRDSAQFKKLGFKVKSFDQSLELVKIGKEKLKLKIDNYSFDNFKYKDQFDGIWACASLLHLTKEELKKTLIKMAKSLNQNGVMYCSFKNGTFSGLRGDRFFQDFTPETFKDFLSEMPHMFNIKKEWITQDLRKGKEGESWYNVILVNDSLFFRKDDIGYKIDFKHCLEICGHWIKEMEFVFGSIENPQRPKIFSEKLIQNLSSTEKTKVKIIYDLYNRNSFKTGIQDILDLGDLKLVLNMQFYIRNKKDEEEADLLINKSKIAYSVKQAVKKAGDNAKNRKKI